MSLLYKTHYLRNTQKLRMQWLNTKELILNMESHEKHTVGDGNQFLVRLNESYYLQLRLRLFLPLYKISHAICKTAMAFWENYYSFRNKHNHLQLNHASTTRIIIC